MTSSNLTNSMPTDAIVCTMGQGINALSIVRSLGRAGIRVHVIAHNPDRNLAIHSRYCISRHFLEEVEPYVFKEKIHAIAKRCSNKPVLYVDNDKMLNVMLATANNLDADVLFTSQPIHISKILDKKDQVMAASAAGLSVPESWFPNHRDEIAAIKSSATQHLIAKTRFPVADREKPFKVLSATHGVDLLNKLQKYPFLTPEELFIQEYIEGGDDEVYFALCYAPLHSEQAAVVTGRKLVQSGSGDGGVMVLGETEPNEKIHDLSIKMINHLGYKGYFGIEFKYSRKKNDYFFIEVNVRPERFNTLGRVATIDLNIISYFDACNIATQQLMKPTPQTGVWIDGKGLGTTLRRRKEFNILHYFLKNLHKKKEFAILAKDDLQPFWHSLIRWDKD